jgi:PAS domain S-box-containing protein
VEGKLTGGVAAQGLPSTKGEADVALAGHAAWPAHDQARPGELVFQHAPVGIQEIDAQGRFVRANAAFSRMTGYAPGELIGRSMADFVDRDASSECVERLQGLLRRGSGVVRFDLAYRRRDGSLLQGRVTAGVLPTDSGDPVSVIALVEDASGDLPDEGVPSFAGARVDAVETVAGAVAQARDAAHEKGIDIAYAYATAPVWVHADEPELRKAVDQLLTAALRSTRLGALAVRCTAHDGDALLEVLEVREPGIAGAELGAIFEPRAQIDAGDTRPGDERALGHARALAQAQHGVVGMTSSPESGNRITMRLPLARD